MCDAQTAENTCSQKALIGNAILRMSADGTSYCPSDNEFLPSLQTPFPLPPALCDSRRSSSYRRHAPSKQHLLCDGRSAAEVVLRHKDFRRARRRAKKKVQFIFCF